MRALAAFALFGLVATGDVLADDVPLEDIIVERAANTLLGSSIGSVPVVTADGQTIGDVSDVILSDDGRVVALVVGVGGFLGIAEKPVAIRWEQLSVRSVGEDDVAIVCALDRAALDAAPRYRERED